MNYQIHWKKGLMLLLIPVTLFCTTAWTTAEETCEEIVVTKLIDICGQNQIFGGNPPPVECEQGAMVLEMDEQCQDYFPLTLYMTNVHPNPTNHDEDYVFPAGKDPIYVAHEVSPGQYMMSAPLTSAKYKGDIPVGLDLVPVFGIDLELYTTETNEIGCEPDRGGVRNFPMNVTLYRWKEGVYEIYPVASEASAQSGLFSCDIFSETNCACLPPDPNKPCEVMPPIYDITVCIDCHCDEIKPRLTNPNELDEAKPYINDVLVSPNPSQDNFNLSYNIQESTEVTFRIVDYQGKEMQRSKAAVESGEQIRNFNISQLSTGVYFLQIITDQLTITEKVTVIK